MTAIEVLLEKFVERLYLKQPVTDLLLEIGSQNIGVSIEPSLTFPNLIHVRLEDLIEDKTIARGVRIAIAVDQLRDTIPEPIPSIPNEEWTDEEWIAVMNNFDPKADTTLAERWVAKRRAEHSKDE